VREPIETQREVLDSGCRIVLLPPFIIENQLPVPMPISVLPMMLSDDIQPGASKFFYEFDNTMDLQLHVQPSGFIQREAPSISHSTHHNPDDTLVLYEGRSDTRGEKMRTLSLQLAYRNTQDASGARRVAIRAPYWIVNHTGFSISIKEVSVACFCGCHLTSPSQTDQLPPYTEQHFPDGEAPILFSCASDPQRLQFQVQLVCLAMMTLETADVQQSGQKSLWSNDVPLDNVGRAFTLGMEVPGITLPSSGHRRLDFVVEVGQGSGPFAGSKVSGSNDLEAFDAEQIVTILPQVVLSNTTPYTLHVMQSHETDAVRYVKQWETMLLSRCEV
jgi:hypothetical protein